MNPNDPLEASLLDLHTLLGQSMPLILGGGYGLYLKQRSLSQNATVTRFTEDRLPDNRTTEDIDLFLRAEVVVDADRMKTVRDALDTLRFEPVLGSEYMQFAKAAAPAGEIKIDLLVGPLGELFDPKTVKRDDRRVRPKAFKQLHAHPLNEAVAIEEHLTPIEIKGSRSDGSSHTATIYVPQPFTYLLMKLLAFRDRVNDEGKSLARHHALDVYRIIGLVTEPEDPVVRTLAAAHRNDPKVIEARAVVADFFARPDLLGVLRMREHPLFLPSMNIEDFIVDLTAILPPA